MKGPVRENLRVNVDRIPDGGLAVRAGEVADSFPALKAAAADGGLAFDSPLEMDLRLRRVSGFVEASGQLRISVRLACSRCLAGFSQPLSIPFEATWGEALPAPGEVREDAEVELTDEAIDLFPFHGREIDLLEAVQEQVLMALPLRPLCREECRGLCPRCGADLNQGDCGCSEKPVDPRLAVLKNLKLDDGEG